MRQATGLPSGRPTKTIFWKNAKTKDYGDKAKESYLRISKRSSTITR